MLFAVELFGAVNEFVAPGLLKITDSAGAVALEVLFVTCSAGFSSDRPTLNLSLNFSTKRICGRRSTEKPGRYCPSMVCGMFSVRTPRPTVSAVTKLHV